MEACVVVDEPHQMRFFFFRLGKVSDFRFCFYHLMIEVNTYLYFVLGFAVLVGWVFFFFLRIRLGWAYWVFV